jgi:inner membrane protein
VVALVTHPLLDAFTSYGTQLLSPFSDRRFAWDGVAIIDPAYSLVLGVGIACGLWRGVASRASQAAAVAALLSSTAYLAYGYALNERLEDRVRGDLAREGAPGAAQADVRAFPTLLQLSFRRVVARVGGEVRVGFLNARRPARPGEWDAFRPAQDPRIDAALATREGRILHWFADGLVVGRVVENGAAVELDDLRYGFPGRPEHGLWGIRVPLGPDGRPSGPASRFNRPLPAPASSLLARLVREAWAN